jgi:hypothetical protein
MLALRRAICFAASVALVLTLNPGSSPAVLAQSATAPDPATAAPPTSSGDEAPSPLTDDELNALVAPIALYPDDMVALIAAASLYPLQIVEASRFLDDLKKNPDAKPDSTWDGSIISLLNYPDVVKMMNDDLQWTQNLGVAVAYQQKDVLLAIQQLRDKAVVDGALKTDDKITVSNEDDDVIIQPTDPGAVYLPIYDPEMLYVPGNEIEPITYYPQYYPSYYDPTATFYPAAVTGVLWASAIDWGNDGIWAGKWNGNIDVDCKNCLNNINGKVKLGDVDWKNVDRSQIGIDHSQLTSSNLTDMRNDISSDPSNNLRDQATAVSRQGAALAGTAAAATVAVRAKDVRVNSVQNSAAASAAAKQKASQAAKQPAAGAKGKTAPPKAKAAAASKAKAAAPKAKAGAPKAKAAVNHPVSKPKAAARVDTRPANPSGLGEVRPGAQTKAYSSKGHSSATRSSSRPATMSAPRGGGGGGGGGGRGGGGGGRR